MAISVVSLVLQGCSTGGPGALSAGYCSLYRIWSLTHLISNCNCSIRGLRAHTAGCRLSLPHLVSNWSGLQLVWSPTNWLPVSLSYIIVQRPLLLVGVTIALIQPIHGQDYNSDIPRPDAPILSIAWGRIVRFIHFSRVLARIWTRVAMYFDDIHYDTSDSQLDI